MSGCNLGKSVPGVMSMWKKSGADFTEIGKALLECSMLTPYDADQKNQKLKHQC